VIFVDSNIPMYLIGAEHPHKHNAQRLIDTAVFRRERLVTDAETIQEILHRYAAIDRLEAVQPAFDVLLSVVDEVFPVTLDVVERAKEILSGRFGLSARDAVHLAAMGQADVRRIMSFDTGFDRYPGVERLS